MVLAVALTALLVVAPAHLAGVRRAVTPASEAGPLLEADVVHVDDGDTVDVRIGGRDERVRYAGIDAPEIAHGPTPGTRGGREAASANAALVAGRHVTLEVAAQPRDRYGRLLAYVWRDGVMVNAELVRLGWARVMTIPPNTRYRQVLQTLQSEAQRAGRGLWALGGAGLSVGTRQSPHARSARWRRGPPARSSAASPPRSRAHAIARGRR
ncbi:MAG: thermonuclease family protein [Candidatus Rokubacteria bacterium]|nr:thermonuclease family protein [Candidatus Rokubacteria bacterium]